MFAVDHFKLVLVDIVMPLDHTNTCFICRNIKMHVALDMNNLTLQFTPNMFKLLFIFSENSCITERFTAMYDRSCYSPCATYLTNRTNKQRTSKKE